MVGEEGILPLPNLVSEDRSMAFDPKRYVIKVQGGREYLPVSARLIWFRSEHPDWGILTEMIEINHEKQYAIFRATIFNEEGRLIATATKKEDVRGFGDYIEKSETGSVGRALAMCGYGAQFAPELEESGPRRSVAPARPAPAAPQGSYGPPQRLAPPPGNAARPLPPREDDSPFVDEPLAPPPARPAPRPTPVADLPADLPPMRTAASLQRPAPRPQPTEPTPTAPPMRPVPAGAPIQRVREPERNLPDPGGDEELDDLDDPFAEDEAPPPPRQPARAAAPRPAPRKPADSLL